MARTNTLRTSTRYIIPLRHLVLRPGLPVESAHFDGDDHEHTRHYAIFELRGRSYGRPLCCATFVLNVWDGVPAWQLRGMATDPECVGTGLGKELLSDAELSIVRHTKIPLFWCNAREEAIGFYLKQGWAVVSDIFDIPGVGRHVKMVKKTK